MLIRSSNRLPVFGNCDSFRFETFLNYLIRLGTVSNRSSPPDSSFAFSTRERARGTGEFCLAELSLRFRGVEPTSLTQLFPGHPGLSWKRTASILLSAARFVLSMNCEQVSKFFSSFNELICTACSQNCACEEYVNKANKPMKSTLHAFPECELFTKISDEK